MNWLSVALLLTLYFVHIQSQNVICKKGKSSKTVKIDANEKFTFKTQKGKKYLGLTTCAVIYKLGPSCKAMKFQCAKSNINSKDKNCKKGDKLYVTAGGKTKKYCKTKRAKAMSKKGVIKVLFKSDKSKSSTGSVCKILCTTKKTTTPAPTTG